MTTALKIKRKSAFYLFLIDISKKSYKGGYDSVQSEYLDVMTRIQRSSSETCENLPVEHPWRFVFELIREHSDRLANALLSGPIGDHTLYLGLLIDVYNACAQVRPWKPPKNRFLAWLCDTGGWEDRIRRLVFEYPLNESDLKKYLDSMMADIERLVYIANSVSARWG